MSENKLVSVVIPTYNLADLVGETIQSVLDQDYRPIEIIVVNDCSTDNTLEVLKKYSSIVVITTPKNSERCFSRNFGAEKATGFYIKWLDHDDLLTPNCISSQVAYMESNPDIDCIFSNIYFFKVRVRKGITKKLTCGLYFGSPFNWDLKEAMLENLNRPQKLDRNPIYVLDRKANDFRIPASTLLYKKKIFDSGVRWDPEITKIAPHNEDFDFYLNVVSSGFKLAYFNFHALNYRSHPRQTLKAYPLTNEQAYIIRKYIFEKYRQKCQKESTSSTL